MVLVHPPVEQIQRVVELARVGTRPAQVFRDAALADEPRPDVDPEPLIGLRQFLCHAFEVGQLPAQECCLLLRRLAGHLAQLAVHFDGDAPDAPEIASGIGVGQVPEQPVELPSVRALASLGFGVAHQQLEAVADQVVVGLFVQRALQLRLANGLAPVERPAFLGRVAVRAQDKVGHLPHHGPGVRRPALRQLHAQHSAPQRLARQRRVLPALLRVLRVEVALAGGFRGRARPAASLQHFPDGGAMAAPPLAPQPLLHPLGQNRPERRHELIAMNVSPHRIENQGALGIGMGENLVEVIRQPARLPPHGSSEFTFRQVAFLFHRRVDGAALGGGEIARLALPGRGDLDLRQLHGPAEAMELDAPGAGDLGALLRFVAGILLVAGLRLCRLVHTLEGDRAAGNDAVVKTGHQLPEEQPPGAERAVAQPLAVARRGRTVRRGQRGVIAHERVDQPVVHLGQDARVSPENALHLRFHSLAGKGRAQIAHPAHGGFHLAKGINLQLVAEDLGHCALPAMLPLELREQFARPLFLLAILRAGLVLPAPAPVAIVAAVVSIPAQHVPQLGPAQRLPAPQHPRRQQPRPRAAGRLQLSIAKHAQVRQQTPHPRDPLPGGPNMPPLPPEPAPHRCQAIIRREDDGAAAQQGRVLSRPRLQDRPANRAVAYVEGKAQVGDGYG